MAGLTGCRHAPERVTPGKPVLPKPLFAPAAPSMPQEALPLSHWTREERTTHLLDMMRKRVWGRRASLPDIKRVVTEVGPLVRDAAQQEAVLPYLQQIAQDNHQTLDEARETWIRLQEADLLLEAGGDPDDVSPAGAVGVAQWMPSTAVEHGLKVNLTESRRLTARINDLNWRYAWLTYLARKDVAPNAPGKPPFTPADIAQWDAVRMERVALRLQRQQIDDRYEPRTAIFAHTRYLLRLYPKFPSLDWVFQAYHGGEGGVKKALRLYLGVKPSSAATAIRTGKQGGRLTYEDVYFTVSPRAHVPEFSYLYGRGDDHRHYWWKLKSSEQALAAYRRDPNGFEKTWAALLPGRRTEAVWYPDAPAHAIADLNALRAAQGRGLAPIPSNGEVKVCPAPLDTLNASLYAALQSPAKGALLLAASAYKQAGGKAPLLIGDMTVTPEYAALIRAAHPPKLSLQPLFPPDPNLKTLPGGGPPTDFDYHTTGLAFDILRPAALQRLENAGIRAWLSGGEANPRRHRSQRQRRAPLSHRPQSPLPGRSKPNRADLTDAAPL